jgi:hypothetical protein
MSVYVGIDVHRKWSQVGVINRDGEVLANRTVPHGVAPILGAIGSLPAGTPTAFKAAYGWGWLVEDYGFVLHLVHPLRCKGHRLGAAEERQGRRRDLGLAAARRLAARGVDRPAAGEPATDAAAAPGPAAVTRMSDPA